MERFGLMHIKQQQIVKDFNDLDVLEEQGDLNEAQFKLKLQLQEDSWIVATFNESLLLQKSREKWIKKGNCNSKFFHSIINWRRRKNSLKGMYMDGMWLEEPIKVKEEVKNFFENRFMEDKYKRPKLDGVNFKRILNEDNGMLLEEFEEDEVRQAIRDYESSKELQTGWI